jgi:hypothetical protein
VVPLTGPRPKPVSNGGFWTVNGSPIQPMKPTFKKLASILFVTVAYAVAGWSFFFVFFRSQF